MNNTVISGRLTASPDLRYTPSGVALAKFTLAVQDDFKNAQGERETNFIDCTAWKGTAEFVAQHSGKGLRLMVVGRLKQEKWQDKDGNNRSKLTVTAEKVEPVDWASDAAYAQTATDEGAEILIDDGDVPF